MSKENQKAKSKAKTEIEEQEVEATVEAVEVAEAEVKADEPVQLQINDLQSLGQIINLACKRGAFEAAEMETVGATFNKLNAFLGYVAATASVAKKDEAGDTAGEAE